MKAKEQIRFLKEEGLINETAFPGFRPPMLASFTKEYFDNPGWVYERKLDGIRCIVLREGKKISLFREWTAAGKLRHPSFIRMRYDKEPENVIKETEDENS
jgi:ATP-dependent DNA ligase